MRSGCCAGRAAHSATVLVRLLREHLTTHFNVDADVHGGGTRSPSAAWRIERWFPPRHSSTELAPQDEVAADEALVVAETLGWPLERAGAFEDVAMVLPDRRRELFEAAATIYESVGAERDARRVHAALGRKPAARRAPRPKVGWDALTAAERDVVTLAAEGLTNRQIGERLFVSHRTVATHLSHVFEKLGVRSRVELAREAARRAARRQPVADGPSSRIFRSRNGSASCSASAGWSFPRCSSSPWRSPRAAASRRPRCLRCGAVRRLLDSVFGLREDAGAAADAGA